jgi:hypothetical protein
LIEMIFSGFQVDGGPGPLAPTRLLTGVGWFGIRTEHWSTPVALLWTPVFVGAAVLALRFRAAREQHGRPPSLLEVIRHPRRPR